MATYKANYVLCGICEAQHITNEANIWCPDCEEGLCSNCEKQHKLSKSSKNHTVISIDDYLKIPKPILDIVHHCSEHNRKYQMFCVRHDDICCPLCISSYHKNCTGLLAIEEMVKMSHSTVLENTEKILGDLIKNVDKAIKNRKQNLAEIKEKRKVFQDQINKLRNQVVTHINKLEKQALKDFDIAEEEVSSKIHCVLTMFDDKARILTEFHNNITAVKRYASQLQIYLGLKTVAKNVEKEEQGVKLLFEHNHFKNFDLKCEISTNIASNIQGLKSICSVQIASRPVSLVYVSSFDKQAQMFNSSSILKTQNSFDLVRLDLERKFKISKGRHDCKITGCTVLPSGKMIFSDCEPNKRLVYTNHNGIFEKEMYLSPTRPYDVFGLDEKTVALSVWNPSEIQIFNIEKKKVEKRYGASKIRGGLIRLQGKWVYRNHNGLVLLQESDRTISTFVKRNDMALTTYLATDEEHVFASYFDENIVTCYDLDGKMVWEYKNDRLLCSPFGITVDKISNVYVISSSHKNIVMISPDGERGRHLLDADFFTDLPRAINFDKERNKLLVVTESGVVHLFKVL